MAGGENWNESKPTPEEELQRQLAYRGDLAEAIGIIVSQPPHSLDETGKILWGDWYSGNTIGSQLIWDEISDAVLSAIDQAMRGLVSLPPLERTIPTHQYEHPPAAQSIPEIAAMIYEHGRPILDDGLLLYEAGKLIRGAYIRIDAWIQKKGTEVSRLDEPVMATSDTPPHPWEAPNITLTQGSLIALVVAEIVDRVGFQKDMEIDSQARGFMGYNSPNHPNSRLKYLMRISYGGEQYGYVLGSNGKVLEHFRIDENELVSLQIPDVLGLGDPDINQYDDQPSDEKLRLRMT